MGLRWLYPKAKIIYIYRNGIDVVYSMTKYGTFSTRDFETLCKLWDNCINKFSFLLDFPDSITVRYEDFLNSPKIVFRQICDFLNIENDNRPEEYTANNMLHPLDKGHLKKNPRDEMKKRVPAYSIWTQNQKEIFKKTCSNSMNKMNYDICF